MEDKRLAVSGTPMAKDEDGKMYYPGNAVEVDIPNEREIDKGNEIGE